MTNKAKTYLKNIQEADTEKKLIGIEIAFKQDMTLSCSDLGSLCKAAEDKRYSLRNNEETLKLKHPIEDVNRQLPISNKGLIINNVGCQVNEGLQDPINDLQSYSIVF